MTPMPDLKLIADMLEELIRLTDEHPIESIRAQIRLLRAADESDGWLPIESAPMHTSVLVAFIGFVGEAKCSASTHGRSWWWANTDWSDNWAQEIYPTHWRPLPPPPTQEGGGNS